MGAEQLHNCIKWEVKKIIIEWGVASVNIRQLKNKEIDNKTGFM